MMNVRRCFDNDKENQVQDLKPDDEKHPQPGSEHDTVNQAKEENLV